MNNLRAENIYTRNSRTLLFLTSLLIVLIVPVLYFLLSGRLIYIGFYLAVPVTLLLVSSPKASFAVFMFSIFLWVPYRLSSFAIHPWDLTALIFIASCMIDWLINIRTVIVKTRFDLPFILIIVTAVISGVFAYSQMLSVFPVVRLILIYLIFRSFFYISDRINIESMIRIFILAHVIFSLYNNYLFLSYGGAARVFGISSIAFETFSMIGVPLTLAMSIWSNSRKWRFYYFISFLIVAGAALATMSRGALLTIIIAVTVLIYFSFRKAGREKAVSVRKVCKRLIYAGIPVIVIIIIASGLFGLLFERFESISFDRATGTILLRIQLWRAALEAFMMDPLTGIGIGNYKAIFGILPEMRLNSYVYYLIGYSTHNVFLQQLSETGIFGGLALLYLGLTAIRSGYRLFRDNTDMNIMAPITAAFITAFIFFITIFYMRAWLWGQEGYTLAFILSITARLMFRSPVKGDTHNGG